MRHFQQPGSITFQAIQDLMRKPNGQVLLYKGNVRCLTLTKNRVLQSYIDQFCGMMGILKTNLIFSRPAEVQASAAAAASANLPDLLPITDHCQVSVSHCPQFHTGPKPLLKPALRMLLKQGLRSDLEISFKGKMYRCHKCIMVARSPFFKQKILEKGQQTSVIAIEVPLEFLSQDSCSQELFSLILQWIYSDQIQMPEKFSDLVALYSLAWYFQLQFLCSRCQEELVLRINPQEVLNILQIIRKKPDIIPERIVYHCKTTFLKNFPQVVEANQNLEERLNQMKGLTIELFEHVSELQKKKNNRRVHFAGEELDTSYDY